MPPRPAGGNARAELPQDASDCSGATLPTDAAHGTPEHGAHLAAMADPRAHPRLSARGRVSAGDARAVPGRLPSAGAGDRLRRPVATAFSAARTRTIAGGPRRTTPVGRELIHRCVPIAQGLRRSSLALN